MSSSEALANRVTSAANVSVGTSIAMETICPSWPVFDLTRQAPPKVKITDYKYAYFNLWTLGRNLLNAVASADRHHVNPAEAAIYLVEEAEEIVRAIKHASAGSVIPVIYFPSYKRLGRDFPKGKLREAVTDKAKAAQLQFERTCEAAAKQLDVSMKNNFKRFDVRLGVDGVGNTLLFTHFAVDLLSEKVFGKCALLESHTGVVKQKNQWHTKLFNGKAFPNIPLNELTIQVFGDDHQFRPWEMKIKQALIDMAVAKRWSWATTNIRMKMDVGSHPDQMFATALISLL